MTGAAPGRDAKEDWLGRAAALSALVAGVAVAWLYPGPVGS